MERPYGADRQLPVEAPQSAVSWGAIVAGALGAATLTVILTLVGSGLGLTIVSPWPGHGAGLTTFAASTAVGLIVIQWLASAAGGYLTGRLRTAWVGVRSDEVFFRDTAHGFLAWALATLLMVGTLGASLSAAVGGGVRAASTVAAGTASGAAAMADNSSTVAYYVDSLLRPNDPSSLAGQPDGRMKATAEITRILAQGAVAGTLGADDKAYLARLIAANAGLSEQEANARIDTLLVRIEEAKGKAREAADAARKAGAAFALASALSLLIGAFIAGVAAAVAGRQRDDGPDALAGR